MQTRNERQQTIAAAIQVINTDPPSKLPPTNVPYDRPSWKRSTLGELKVLCAEVVQNLADDGIKLQESLESVGSESTLDVQVLDLINYLERRSYLTYLVEATRRARPGII